MDKKKIEKFLKENPGYLKKSPLITLKRLSEVYGTSVYQKDLEAVKQSQKRFRGILKDPDDSSSELLFEYKEKQVKRLFFDIETSPNMVFSWNIGNKISLSPDNIIQERAIICICYKWEGENKVYSLSWNNGDDSQLMSTFAKIISTADEVIGHNSKNYDTKWVKARAIYHNIPLTENFKQVDTLSLARTGFRFNSNRLNYIGQYLGLGEKISTTYDLWKKIVLGNDKKALQEMVTYCIQDVNLLEKVYQRLNVYTKKKKAKLK